MAVMFQMLPLLLGVFVISVSLTAFYRTVAQALGILDNPNDRTAHLTATPTGAGLCFVVASGIGLLVYGYRSPEVSWDGFALFVPACFGAMLGYVDDLKDLAWWLRLILQIALAWMVMWFIDFPLLLIGGYQLQLDIFGELLGALGLVALLNFYNFMDGIDGIAASEGVFVLLAVCVIGGAGLAGLTAVPLLIVAVGLLGFLVWNKPKARVFMGDAGAIFLGLLLGTLMLTETLIPIWSWLILLGVFVVDPALTLFHRALRRQPLNQAHSEHAYQHLNRSVGNWQTLGYVHGLNFVWLLPMAWLAAHFPQWGGILLIFAYLPVAVLCQKLGSGRQLS